MSRELIPYNVMRHRNWDVAPREPITLAIATAAGVAKGTFAYAAISLAVNVAVSVVTSWALSALTPKPDFGSLQSSGLMVNAREATAPQDFVYGQVRKGGVVTYYETTGTNNKFLHQIVALAGHEVEEIGDIYINDEVVTLDANGFVTGDKWKSKVRIEKYDGSQTSAPSNLLSESSQIDSNFVGNGIAYLYVRYEYDQDVFANGVPLVTAVVKGKKVFDPRTDTTAYSNNAALCLRDYITSAYGLDDDDIDDTVFSAAANICDEDVNLDGGGTEDRYTMNGAIKANTNHGDVLNRMVTTCAGTLFWGAGNWKLTAGAYSAPSKTLTLDDLRGPISLDTRTNLRDQFNIVQGTFNDADQRWITADYPPIKGTSFITEDNGIEQPLDFELPLTTSAATAQRLAKLTLYRGREQMTLSADFGLNAFDVEVGEIIALDIDRYGWDQKEFEVIGWNMGPNDEAGDTRVTLTLRETSEAAFDWNAEEQDIINNNTNLPDFTAGLDILGLTASGGGRTQGDGTFINTAILSWTASTNSFLERYEIQWKPVADSDYSSTFTTDNTIELSPLVDGIEYIFRVRAITVLGNRGPFSTVTLTGGGDETAPGLPTSPSASGGFKYITIQWTNPADSDLNYVEIHENTSNTSVGATQVGISSGDRFVRTNLGLNETRYYFLRSVDYSGNKSAFTSGVSATTTYLDDPDFENGVYELFKEQDLYAIEDVTSLPPSGDFVGQKVFNRTDGKLYEWNGSAWALVIASAETDDLIGEITETQISDGAISTPKLQAGAVTATEIAGSTITGDKIVANTITGGLLATSGIITSSAQIDNAVVTNAKIANAAVDTAQIANAAITDAKIDNLAVTSAKIQDLAVDTIKVADRAITEQTSVQSSGGTNTTASYSTIASLNFSASSGEQVLIGSFFDFEVDNDDPNDAQSGRFRILFNGSVIDSDVITAPQGEGVSFQQGIVSSETTQSGTNTISVQIKCDSSTQMSVSGDNVNLFALEALK